MNINLLRFGIFSITFALTYIFSSCQNSPKEIKGSYKLIVIEEKTDSAWVIADWMKDGKGFLQYSEGGIMSVHFTPKDYEHTGKDAYWYVAEYKYFSDEGLVRHKRIIHSDTAEIGEKVTRRIQITGNRLFMFAEEYNFRLTWEKINAK